MHPSLSLLLQLTALACLAKALDAQLLYDRQISSAAPSASSSAAPVDTTITTSIFPGGVSPGSTGLESTLPLPCIDGCWYFAAPYSYCFLFDTRPNGTVVGYTCNGICNQTYYDGLSSCLNCIIANGGEKPFGYSTNTSITQYPSRTAGPSGAGGSRPLSEVAQNPNGVIDLTQANGWLRNVTSYCAAQGTSLAGAASVTAVPTTTGPFAASWSSGQTISRTAWTGLMQYTPPVAIITATMRGSASTGISTPAGSGSSAPSSNPTSVTGAAASQSSRAVGWESAQKPGRWMVGGALLTWAVL